MSNAITNAAIPTALAIINAAKQLIANLGTDPAQIPFKAPGAIQIFVGTVEMQFPSLAVAELGAVQTDVNSKLDGLSSKLQAQLAQPAATTV
jgi:hypothetical protein